MEIGDLAHLTGAAATTVLERASVLHRPEPLVVPVAGDVDPGVAAAAAATLRQAPTLTVVTGDPDRVPPVLAGAADVCLTSRDDPPRPWVRDDPEAVAAAVAAQPQASLALAALLRTGDGLDPWPALAAEAATYAMLLGGAAHQRWLQDRGEARARPHHRPPVATVRSGDRLDVTLDREEARNAIDRPTRDALVEALALPLVEPGITAVHLRGRGPTFSAGGDLNEFGQVPDPATAFAVRLARHPGWAAHQVADRLTAHLHGPCVGAGVEVPAFAARVEAHPATTFRLPELALGLVPGAGGTVSLPRRIGRQRTAWLVLTGTALDAATARRWGLVDALAPDGERPGPAGSSA